MPKTFQVGDTFTHVRECDRYRPIYYAAASGDFNPIHIDPEMGKAAGLNGNILQGLCTMGWAVEAAVRFLEDPSKVRKVSVRFSKPVAIEDTITFEGRVKQIENGVLTLAISAKNQRGEVVLKNATIEASS